MKPRGASHVASRGEGTAGAVGDDPYRRGRALRWKALLGLTGIGLYAAWVEPRWVEVTCREFHLPRLPAAWDGLRIAHLTDLHFGDMQPARDIRSAIDRVLALAPELVLITGDFVSGLGLLGSEARAALAAMAAAPLGAFAVLGNHDHRAGASEVIEATRAAGIHLLRNAHVTLSRGGAPLTLLGVDWPRTHLYHLPERHRHRHFERLARSLDQANAGVPPDHCRILLVHGPDLFPRAAEVGIDLTLCGHTHGGQVRFPLVGAVRVPCATGTRYAAGFFRAGQSQCYVSRGIGMVGIPVRFLCRPEVGLYTLRRAG